MNNRKQPLIMASVIIPTYNRSRELSYTLDSLLNQSLDSAKFEVIVVDDGSSDDTATIIEYYEHLLNIKYFYQEDKGYRVATARNVGFVNASADICVFVDSGILLGANCIEEHIRTHASNQSQVAVIGYIYAFDNEVKEGHTTSHFLQNLDKAVIDLFQMTEPKTAENLKKVNREYLMDKILTTAPDTSIEYFRKNRIYLDPREEEYCKYNYVIDDLPAPWVFFWAGNISINKQCYDEFELFDSAFDGSYGFEDVELGYRLFLNGVKIVLNKNAESIHYPSSSSGGGSASKMDNTNFHRFCNKYDFALLEKLNEVGTVGFNQLQRDFESKLTKSELLDGIAIDTMKDKVGSQLL